MQQANVAEADTVHLQNEDPVNVSSQRMVGDTVMLDQQHRCAAQRSQLRLQAIDEATVLQRRLSEVSESVRAVDDKQVCVVLANESAQNLERPFHVALAQMVVEAEVVNTAGHQPGVEEIEPTQMRAHSIVGLGHHCGEDRMAPGPRTVVRQVIAKHCLARARPATDKIDAASREASGEDCVNTRDIRHESLEASGIWVQVPGHLRSIR